MGPAHAPGNRRQCCYNNEFMSPITVLALAWAFQVSSGPVQAPLAAHDYLVGPNDILKVTVYGHEDLTQVVVVQADGSFTFPLVGRVAAADKTPGQLEKQITEALAAGYVREPQVTVVVQEFRSKVVFVVGEIVRPGTYPLSGRGSLVEILSRAGPMSSNAGSEVLVVRPKADAQGPLLPSVVASGPNAQADVIRINMSDLQAGQMDKNILLRPNDTVFVPAAGKIFVSGEVRNPGAYPFSPGTTVRQAISLAGGFTDRASEGKIRIVRDVDGKTREIKVGLDDPVQPGDSIVVKEKLF